MVYCLLSNIGMVSSYGYIILQWTCGLVKAYSSKSLMESGMLVIVGRTLILRHNLSSKSVDFSSITAFITHCVYPSSLCCAAVFCYLFVYAWINWKWNCRSYTLRNTLHDSLDKCMLFCWPALIAIPSSLNILSQVQMVLFLAKTSNVEASHLIFTALLWRVVLKIMYGYRQQQAYNCNDVLWKDIEWRIRRACLCSELSPVFLLGVYSFRSEYA